MHFKINGTDVDVPSDLSQVTLGQFLTYWQEHGRELQKRVEAIGKTTYDDEFDQSIDLLEVELDEACAWYSFFTGYDFETIKQQQSNLLLSQYRAIKDVLNKSEEETYVLNQEIKWKDAVWTIRDWKVTPNSDFTFNELLTSKEASRQIHSLGKGKWEALPYLCAVFFRKKGEFFKDDFVMEGSERLKLLQDLPMSIALQVAFFLSISISISKEVFQSLKLPEPVIPI